MRIIEQFCQGKRLDQSLNEDGLIVTDGFAAVVDGVTSKSIRHLWHPSSGVAAKNHVLETIAGLSVTSTMREVQQAIDAQFQQAYRECGSYDILVHEPIERLQANAVIYSVHRREIWLFGDCQVMVNGQQTPTVKRVDELLGELRAFTTLALRRQQSSANSTESSSATDSTDPARDMILPFLRLQSQFANARGPYGYFVFDGFTDLTYPIRTVTVSSGDEVVLASDGYPVLQPTLTASGRELQRLKREDPELISEYRSTKGFVEGYDSFDDRTYVRFIA
ncbi:hypothetical protein JS530_01370 [Bifidobacterium sp. LC6]|uniref:Uncharacterized protein n=1 Tax=Bifidobacterium colobi TaxID=2809026 RepID=A0ABS5UT71_9BIFI|nr:hypothetical protein [Bifidobacterium colobi]MBT1174175.1 hypothetical protein [Bifidobacterium colobi]